MKAASGELRGPLVPTRRLVELVNFRLGVLSEAERHVLELTAIGEPLAQPSLDELTERAAVESLEDRGFLTSQMDGRRLQVRLAHPGPDRRRARRHHPAPRTRPGPCPGRDLGRTAQRGHAADRLVAPRRGWRQRGAAPGRGEGGARPARLRAHRAAGPRRHRTGRGFRRPPPGRRGGPPRRPARGRRTGTAVRSPSTPRRPPNGSGSHSCDSTWPTSLGAPPTPPRSTRSSRRRSTPCGGASCWPGASAASGRRMVRAPSSTRCRFH